MTDPKPSSFPANVTVIQTNSEGVKIVDVWTVPADEIHKLYMLLGEPDDKTELRNE